jgi:hypothetical protein
MHTQSLDIANTEEEKKKEKQSVWRIGAGAIAAMSGGDSRALCQVLAHLPQVELFEHLQAAHVVVLQRHQQVLAVARQPARRRRAQLARNDGRQAAPPLLQRRCLRRQLGIRKSRRCVPTVCGETARRPGTVGRRYWGRSLRRRRGSWRA